MNHMPWSASKASLSDDGSEKRLLESDDDSIVSVESKRGFRFWLFQFIFFSISLTLFIASFVQYLIPSTKAVSISQCNERVEMPSPLHNILTDELVTTRINGHFWEENDYKGPPTPERDDAWDELTNHGGGVARISKETLQTINASEHSIELPASMGGGYMASFEVTHQLHCIQLIREWTYRDHYKSKSVIFQDSDHSVRIHLDHCIDMIRQKLMCDSDAGLLTYVWVKDRTKPYADFNVQKKCRNYTKVQEYVRSQYIDDIDYRKPAGAFEFPGDI